MEEDIKNPPPVVQDALPDVEAYSGEEPPQEPPFKKIISLVIGVAVVIGLVALVIFVIIPFFSPKKDGNVNLTYWGIWEDSAPFETVAAEFTRDHPNVKVTIQKQDVKALGKYIDRLDTRMENGTGPDILRYHNSWITELKSHLLPLPQEVVKSLDLDTKYYPVVGRDLKVSGAYYGVPIHFDSLSLFINTDLFKNAGITNYPDTWDDLRNDALQLTVKDSDGRIVTSGAALGTYDNIAHASDIISLLLIQNGADLNNLAGSGKQNAADTFDFYTFFAKGDSKVWDDSLENSKLAFANGKLAMYIGYSWDIFEIKSRAPNLAFITVPVPHLPSRNSTIASYWAEGVSASTKHPKEAFEFLQFLASRQNMEKLYAQESKTRLFGELYPRVDMSGLLKSNLLIYPFVLQGDKAVSTPFSSDTHDDGMTDALNVYMGNAIRSIINDNTSSESSVDTLAAGVNQVKSKYAQSSK